MDMQHVILVNEHDEPIGTMEKLEAHRKSILHRAFSVFIFNEKGEMLLQQRALGKYHSPGLWTNACCSHPSPGESTPDAASRRLREELGFTTPLDKIFAFTYQVNFENGLAEHEFDHVFAGIYDSEIMPDPEEVKDYCYRDLESIRRSLKTHPEHYTAWFHIAFPKVAQWAQHNGLVPATVA